LPWLFLLLSCWLCGLMLYSAHCSCWACWSFPWWSMLRTCWLGPRCDWFWLLLSLGKFLLLHWSCLYCACSSNLLRRSLSDLQYFLNSWYNSSMVEGFSLAKWPAKALTWRPLIATSMATYLGTFGALALSCTNFW
jgi:hypothetical protein